MKKIKIMSQLLLAIILCNISSAEIFQDAYIKASNTGVVDRFGYSVAVSGNTMVVGAPFERSDATGVDGDENNDLASQSGAAYVHVLDNGQWSQQAYLKASNTEAGDFFGWDVAISNDTIVVGAHQEDSSATGVGGDDANNSAFNSGAAYVFVRTNGIWSQQVYLKATQAQENMRFGYSVAVQDNTIVIGASSSHVSQAGTDYNNPGAVFIYNSA